MEFNLLVIYNDFKYKITINTLKTNNLNIEDFNRKIFLVLYSTFDTSSFNSNTPFFYNNI